MFNPVEKLKEYIRFPSVSTDPKYRDGMRGAQEFVSGLLSSLGFVVEVVQTSLHPIILARRGGPAAWSQVIIYGHYDVQPVDPVALWKSEPFVPVERAGRLYGRGAADNKGPLMVHIAAVGRLLEKNPDLPLRITFMIEGEEEVGSPSFPSFLEAYHGELGKADFVFLSDTGSPSEDRMVVTCGLRGLMLFDLEITSAKGDLHSGLHGGVFRNPIQALAEVCASLHSADGRVNIPGFYDDVLEVEPWEKEELAKLNVSEDQYRQFLGVPAFHMPPGYSSFEALRFLPTLEFNGICGGYQGEGTKTVIPSKAIAKISCRLVPDQTPEKIRTLAYKTVRERMPKDVTFRIVDQHQGTPYIVVPPGRSNTPKNQPARLARAFKAVDSAVAEVFGSAPLYLREGGSVPIIGDIKRALGLDSIMLGLFLPEDNMHAPNESFSLRMMQRGIEASEKILAQIARDA
ncbi:MAG: M20/M25/M40 family metallo-hydrolase [Opitutaceae bacterium]|jgi:acetylornithine deacetylase/succinyl-diaminopimelate desuccinylase-like protein